MPAIRYVVSKSAPCCIHLQCHVKPGASKQREGITSVSENVIELCVSARAREGEANKAVRETISAVLNVPKSSVEVIRGLKSRDKIISVSGITDDEETCVKRVKRKLQTAVES